MKINSALSKSGIIIIMILFFACKKENLPNISCNEKSNAIDLVRKLLPGSYSWAYTKETFPSGNSRIETPASTGNNFKYVFYKNEKLYYYKNNVLQSIDSYIIDYEFKLTTYPLDSATVVIIYDSQTGLRKNYFRPYLCTDSSLFYNPYSSFNFKSYYKRN